MIVCPNCLHQNPDGATQCEACYTTLPTTSSCPNCGSSVQTDASFCGQCGFKLSQPVAEPPYSAKEEPAFSPPEPVEIPDLVMPDPLVAAEPLTRDLAAPQSSAPNPDLQPEVAEADSPSQELTSPLASAAATAGVASAGNSKTQLQQRTGSLLHTQSNTVVELPQNLSVIHIGKPNERIPPDIDVAGFPNSEVVSRIHADIRVEGDTFFIEDVGSANGTYINNTPLPPGNRHRLRVGDRIALGKGDLVTFLFQLH